MPSERRSRHDGTKATPPADVLLGCTLPPVLPFGAPAGLSWVLGSGRRSQLSRFAWNRRRPTLRALSAFGPAIASGIGAGRERKGGALMSAAVRKAASALVRKRHFATTGAGSDPVGGYLATRSSDDGRRPRVRRSLCAALVFPCPVHPRTSWRFFHPDQSGKIAECRGR